MASTGAAVEAKLNGPAMHPPPGVEPNFVDPPNLEHIFILVLTLCVSFSAIAVFLRMYTKLFILRKVAFEDCRFQSLRPSSPADVTQTSSFWDG